jgi:hypothetical protein
MLRFAIALVLGAVTAAPAIAQQIVKCTDSQGRIEYRNSACPAGTRRDAVEISNLSIIEAERRGASDRRVDDSPRAVRAPATPQGPSNPILAPGSERGSSGGTFETAPRGQR